MVKKNIQIIIESGVVNDVNCDFNPKDFAVTIIDLDDIYCNGPINYKALKNSLLWEDGKPAY